VARIAVTLLAGLIAVVLLLPLWYGLDSDPPQCFSMFDYRVSCGTGLAFAAGAAVVGVVGIALADEPPQLMTASRI
jgi:hypothetical protein